MYASLGRALMGQAHMRRPGAPWVLLGRALVGPALIGLGAQGAGRRALLDAGLWP